MHPKSGGQQLNSILFPFGSSKGRWTVRGQSQEADCSQAGVGAEICGDVKEAVRILSLCRKDKLEWVQGQLATF